jgi:hypothetical protein
LISLCTARCTNLDREIASTSPWRRLARKGLRVEED